MLDAAVTAVRRFSRFYTRRIGVLEDSLLESGLTLPQGRLLFEVAQRSVGEATPSAMAASLGLDAGYVSRLVAALEGRGLLVRQPSADDRRSVALALTDAGRRAYSEMDARSQQQVGAMLSSVSRDGRQCLIAAMATIERELGPVATCRPQAVLRDRRPGDIGWVVHRHGVLYNREHGWDGTFEALVARVAGEFIEQFDPKRDCCRIAEVEGLVVGSAFVVRTDCSGVAKLRLVYVEPEMRGTGLGRRLVEDCIAFARSAGYRRMTLWTNDPLIAARILYQRLEFVMTASEPVTSFGYAMKSETWERDL